MPSQTTRSVAKEAADRDSRTIVAEPLTAEAFAPYGDVLEAVGTPDQLVNRGRVGRYHNRAMLSADNAEFGLSLHLSEKREAPIQLNTMARHPLGSQTYIPMTQARYIITVAHDENNQPGQVLAFVVDGTQAINYHKNTWHGTLAPLADPGLFAVVDYVGTSPNSEDFWFDRPYLVTLRP